MLAVSLDFRWPPRARFAHRMHIACFPRKHGRSTRPMALARRERFRDTPHRQTDKRGGQHVLFQLWRPFTSPIVRETRTRTPRKAAREAECKNFALFVNPPSVSHAMKLRAMARTNDLKVDGKKSTEKSGTWRSVWRSRTRVLASSSSA